MEDWKLLVVLMLIITGCGGSDGDEPVSSTETPTYGSPSPNTSTEPETGTEPEAEPEPEPETGTSTPSPETPMNTTCGDACGNTVKWCGQSMGTNDECQSTCAEMGQSVLNCLGAGNSCDDIVVCFEQVEQDDEGVDDSDLDATDNDQVDGANGDPCFGNGECDSGLCYTPAIGNQGTCRVNDVGERCVRSADCEFGVCLIRGANDVAGYCSRTCVSFADCPSSWDCEEVTNAAGRYCAQ